MSFKNLHRRIFFLKQYFLVRDLPTAHQDQFTRASNAIDAPIFRWNIKYGGCCSCVLVPWYFNNLAIHLHFLNSLNVLKRELKLGTFYTLTRYYDLVSLST